MQKQIIVTVNQSGEIEIEAVGFKGNACEKATKALEDALGVAGKRKKKPEYHFTSGVSQQQTIG
jgi:hypothetical protein